MKIPEILVKIPENPVKKPQPRKVNAFTFLKCIDGVENTADYFLQKSL